MTKKLDKLMTMDPKEITFEMVHKKLMEIVSTRGRRGTDRQEQVGFTLCLCLCVCMCLCVHVCDLCLCVCMYLCVHVCDLVQGPAQC